MCEARAQLQGGSTSKCIGSYERSESARIRGESVHTPCWVRPSLRRGITGTKWLRGVGLRGWFKLDQGRECKPPPLCRCSCCTVIGTKSLVVGDGVSWEVSEVRDSTAARNLSEWRPIGRERRARVEGRWRGLLMGAICSMWESRFGISLVF